MNESECYESISMMNVWMQWIMNVAKWMKNEQMNEWMNEWKYEWMNREMIDRKMNARRHENAV